MDEGLYFTPKGDDPCLSCTCHRGEPEMCVAALCERPQGCQQYRKDPKECCKFMCLDPGETNGRSQVSLPLRGQRLHDLWLPRWRGLVRAHDTWRSRSGSICMHSCLTSCDGKYSERVSLSQNLASANGCLQVSSQVTGIIHSLMNLSGAVCSQISCY